MSWQVYEKTPPQPLPTSPVSFDPIQAPSFDAPSGYIADDGLVDAVNVALALSQPLLVTGAPGTGKSQLAYSIAAQLGLKPPLVFHTKTTSTARDLFYRYDALRHFRDSHLRGPMVMLGKEPAGPIEELRPYVEYEALGLAILLAMPRKEVADEIPDVYRSWPEGQRSVVLIDEIDKAPRDVPNDILYEIEAFGFTVKETGQAFQAPPAARPIVILTSNSERSLPEPFLRRCVFHHLNFPGTDQLKEIISSRLGADVTKKAWFDKALLGFNEVRTDLPERPPATAELLSWLRFLLTLEGEGKGKDPLAEGIPSASLPILIKNVDGLNTYWARRTKA